MIPFLNFLSAPPHPVFEQRRAAIEVGQLGVRRGALAPKLVDLLAALIAMRGGDRERLAKGDLLRTYRLQFIERYAPEIGEQRYCDAGQPRD